MRVVQITHGEISKDTSARMNAVRSMATDSGNEYMVYEVPSGTKNPIMGRHEILLNLCVNDGQIFYVDFDLVLYRMPVFENRKYPYFAKHKKGMPDELLCYVNGNVEFFRSLYKEKEDRHIFDGMWWFRKILRTRNVNFIPDDIYDKTFTVRRDEAVLAGLGYREYQTKGDTNE